MKAVTAKMTKTMKAAAVMTRKQVVSAGLAEAKTDIDLANENESATITAGIALIGSNYVDIKAAISAAGIDMTGIKPSGYAAKIAEILLLP